MVMPAMIDEKPNPARKNLLEMLSGSSNAAPVQLKNVLPKFLKVTNRGTAKPLASLLKPVPGNKKKMNY